MLRDAEAERAMSFHFISSTTSNTVHCADGMVKMAEEMDPTMCRPDWRPGLPDRLLGTLFHSLPEVHGGLYA